MPTSFNFCISQGSDINLSLTGLDSSGNAMNLSGCSAVGYVKYSFGSTGRLLNLNPQVDSGFVSGIININVSGSLTTGLPITKAVFDLDIVNSGAGTTQKVFYGYVDIYPEVSLF